MFDFLYNQTTSPAVADSHFKKQLHWLLFLRVTLLTFLLGVNFLLQSKDRAIIIPPLVYINIFIIAVYCFTIISALFLTKARKLSRFAYIQVLLDALLISFLVFFTGGSQSIFITIYFVPIIAGSFLLLRRGGLACAAACTLGYGVILALESLDYYPRFFNQFWYRPIENILVVLNYFSIHGVTFFLVGILSALLAERLRKTEKALTRTSLKFDQLSLLYKQIFDDITTGIITVDNTGRITSINTALENISGFGSAEIINKTVEEVFPDLKSPQSDINIPMVELTRKDGNSVPVSYTATRLNMPAGCDGCHLLTLQDLSAIKTMEAKVRKAEKMAAIGEMSSNIAHKFRNPVSVIYGSAQMLCKKLQDDPTGLGLMKIVTRECNRLETNLTDFILFSSPGTPEKEWISLKKTINDVVRSMKEAHAWKEACILKIDVEETLDCWADPQQLMQVMTNLLNNSTGALRNSATGEISVSAEESTAEDGTESTVITITDTGHGIAEEYMERIFEPFYSTNPNSTGLGLAIVEKIVESHDGTVKVLSRPRQYTKVILTLPLPS